MRRKTWWIVGLAIIAIAWWVRGSDEPEPAATEGAPQRSLDRDSVRVLGKALQMVPDRPIVDRFNTVAVTGTVLDRLSNERVGGVEVVFLDASGEQSTEADATGAYRIDVPRGSYHVFVRGDDAFTVGTKDEYDDEPRWLVPGAPPRTHEPNTKLMAAVVATHDLAGVDVVVERGGVVTGRVVDPSGRPLASARVHAAGSDRRPALGTDVALTDDRGMFELRLPRGMYAVTAVHARFAGLAEAMSVVVERGSQDLRDLRLVAGCVITGKVALAGGGVVEEGTLESRPDGADLTYWDGTAGPDGSFWWASTTPTRIRLRARAWSSPPSEFRTFDCMDGTRIDNVVFELPRTRPVVAGVLVDAQHQPVPYAIIGIQRIDLPGPFLIDRTDAHGLWDLFDLPDGLYRLTSHVPGRGVVATTVTSPVFAAVELVLGGTGRIEGKAPIADGSIEVAMTTCGLGDDAAIALQDERRLVPVVDHKFAVDGVPACQLQMAISLSSGLQDQVGATVTAGGVANVEITEPEVYEIPHGIDSIDTPDTHDTPTPDDMIDDTILEAEEP